MTSHPDQLQLGAASDISDKIKDVLYAKAAQRIDAIRPTVGASMFGDNQSQEDQE